MLISFSDSSVNSTAEDILGWDVGLILFEC